MTALVDNEQPLYHGRRVTFEEYLALEPDGYRYDMIDGVLYLKPAHNWRHGERQVRVGSIIQHYLDAHPIGRVFNETDVYLHDGNDDIVRPDICVVKHDRLHFLKEVHIDGPPNLVVELLSDRTAKRDLGTKADRYLGAGVQEYWIIDPRVDSMQVWFAEDKQGQPRWRKIVDSRVESAVLPGLVLEPGRVFR